MMPNYDYSKDLTSDNKNGLVYVIDDDADVRESIKWLLESTNYRVEDYESGETFIAQFNESVPSVILCDLRMPGMSGADVQDHLMRRRIDAPSSLSLATAMFLRLFRPLRKVPWTSFRSPSNSLSCKSWSIVPCVPPRSSLPAVRHSQPTAL